MKNENAVRKLFKDCFSVGYLLGRGGAGDASDAYLDTKDLTVNSKVRKLAILLEKWRKDEKPQA